VAKEFFFFHYFQIDCGAQRASYSTCTVGIVAGINPLNAEFNPICPLLALFGAHHILHVSK